MELRKALEDAIEKESPQDEPITSQPSTESASSVSEASSVDTDSSAESTSPETTPASTTPVEKPADTAPKQPEADQTGKAVHRVDRAPASWKKEAKGEWATVPLHLRQEIHRREMEISRVLQETAPIRQEVEQFREVIAPYTARINSFNIAPAQAVAELLKGDYLLATAPPQQRAQYMAKLIKDYGVDINELDSALSGQSTGQQSQQAQMPDIAALVQQQLNQALAPIYQQQNQAAQRVTQEAEMSVEQMSLDPKYPHFDEVRQDMADLIELSSRRGIALSLEDAYNKATGINPQFSSLSMADAQNSHAQRIKAASGSITGAPVVTGNTGLVSDGSLRGTIEAAFGGQRV